VDGEKKKNGGGHGHNDGKAKLTQGKEGKDKKRQTFEPKGERKATKMVERGDQKRGKRIMRIKDPGFQTQRNHPPGRERETGGKDTGGKNKGKRKWSTQPQTVTGGHLKKYPPTSTVRHKAKRRKGTRRNAKTRKQPVDKTKKKNWVSGVPKGKGGMQKGGGDQEKKREGGTAAGGRDTFTHQTPSEKKARTTGKGPPYEKKNTRAQ